MSDAGGLEAAKVDFFISYTVVDQDVAEWIAWVLEDAGYQTVIQVWDFRPGREFITEMQRALVRADRVLAVLSPAYLRSSFARQEWNAALAADPRGTAGRLLPVRVAAVDLQGLDRPRIYVDLVGLPKEEAKSRLLAGVKPGRAKPAEEPRFRERLGQPPTAAKTAELAAGSVVDRELRWPTRDRPISNLPVRNRNFTGRERLLAHLDRGLTSKRAAAAVAEARAVHGLGGVGKTHLALEYAHRHARDYDLIWWVIADQPAAIAGQLVALARRLGLPEAADETETVAVLLDEFRHHDRWLLVFDNAEGPDQLRAYWPPGGEGHVLVTSRNPTWAAQATAIGVDVLSRPEAVAFPRRRAGVDKHAADGISAALGDLPLALEQAAAYLEATSTAPGEYLELLRDRGPQLFRLGRPATSEQTIATVWALSLERVKAEAPAAQDLLALCAFLAPDDLPRAVLMRHPDLLPDPLGAAVSDRVGLQQTLGALRRYSLAAVTAESISVHRLVQAVIRDGLDQHQQERWIAIAARLLEAAFPDPRDDPDTWSDAAALVSHALGVVGHLENSNAYPEMAVSMLNRVGAYSRERAEYSEAKPLLERALALAEKRLGPDRPDTALSLRNLAEVLREQGDLTGAQALHDRAVRVYETCLGPDHPDTAESISYLARILRAQGDLTRARSLFERALAVYEARFGPDDSRTAWSLSNLANALYDQGDLDGARPMYERALGIDEVCFGPDHPHTAWSLDHVARVLRATGNLSRARALYERALAIHEARLGLDHPTTAWSLNHLANLLRDQGDLDAARTLHERALAIREARLGPEHHMTAWSLSDLASVLNDQGDLAGARALFERALAIREKRLGSDHPETARSRQDLTALTAELDGGSQPFSFGRLTG
jgi:tetratricopeptide (TPR) repeat protein